MNKTSTLLLVAALAVLTMVAPAQAQHRVGMAVYATSTNLFPFSGAVRKGQYLWNPSDLANLRSGYIDTLFFRRNSSNTAGADNNLTDLSIAITQTTLQQFPSAAFLPVSDTVLVASSFLIPAGPASTWVAFPLQRAYRYDSTQSLVIEVVFTSNNGSARGWANKTSVARRVTRTTGNVNLQNDQADLEFNVTPTPSIPVVSAKDRVVGNRLLVYPNPAREAVQVQLPVAGNLTHVTLFGAQGSQHHVAVQQQGNTLTLPLTNLPVGLYRLVLNLPEGTFTASVVKE